MKIVLVIVALIVVAAIVVYIIGSRLPVHHVATRSVQLNASPQHVYALIRDVAAAPSWRGDVKRVEILSPTQFREQGEHGGVTYDIVEDLPPGRFVTRIADRNLGYGGSWTWDVTPSAAGSRLTITENGEVTNIFFRFMSRFVFGHTATIDKVLTFATKRFS
jgi:hypothetical protein